MAIVYLTRQFKSRIKSAGIVFYKVLLIQGVHLKSEPTRRVHIQFYRTRFIIAGLFVVERTTPLLHRRR
jgi:hypothetical protein